MQDEKETNVNDFLRSTTYAFIIELMTWKSSWSSYILAVVFYCQVYFTIVLQYSLTLPRNVWPSHGRSIGAEETTPAPGLWLRDHEGSCGVRLWRWCGWWVAGKKPWPGWEGCSRVVHMSFVHTGQMPKHLDCAALRASHVAGVWPSCSRDTCLFRMQTYF